MADSPLASANDATSIVDAKETSDSEMGINIPGLISIIIFYLVVLLIGIWAGWRQRKSSETTDQETVMLAGRNIGLFVGVLTMGATWVGGGFINGSAEETYKAGLIWTQAPFGYGLSLFISGTFFAKKMRDAEYLTMIDPFTQKYGRWGALQALPAAVSEVFWSASILAALGSTLQVILHIDVNTSIIISAVIAVCYTLFGGLISVAYTDVFQLFFIAFGLFLSLPFALNSEFRRKDENNQTIPIGDFNWKGEIRDFEQGVWIDYAFLLLLGGIPWQCYYQRVLSSQTSARAVLLSYGGGLIALFMTGPSVFFGMIALATDWEAAGYGPAPSADKEVADTNLVLPLCLQYLTPTWVAFFGLGAISAAVMSSTDSSMLSASTMMARNVYRTVLRPKAKDKEVLIALWCFIVVNCFCATLLAITYKSIYDLFVLCGDFVFVIVFPQLLLVLYFDQANTYGSVFSYIVGLALRLLCGEKKFGLDPLLVFGKMYAECPDYDASKSMADLFLEDGTYSGPETGNFQYEDEYGHIACISDGEKLVGDLPFRTFVMIISMISHILVSWLTHYLFVEEKIPLKFDFFNCYKLSQSTGLVTSASSRHMEPMSNSNGISLDELAGRGNFIPRPQADVKMR